MNNNRIKKIGLRIKGKVYYFFFNFNLVCNLEERYGTDNAIAIINQFLLRINVEENFIKILCASCLDTTMTENFLKENLTFNKQVLNLYFTVTNIFFVGYAGQLKTAVDTILNILKDDELRKEFEKTVTSPDVIEKIEEICKLSQE